MVTTHLAVLATALLALLGLPCAVAVVFCADESAARRFFSRRQETRALRCLDRDLSDWEPGLPPADCEVSIREQEAELRRLDKQRRSSPTIDSVVWLAAVLRAYDLRLALASRSLGLPEHLAQLDGMDRELERVRVEGLLHAAGLRVRAG